MEMNVYKVICRETKYGHRTQTKTSYVNVTREIWNRANRDGLINVENQEGQNEIPLMSGIQISTI